MDRRAGGGPVVVGFGLRANASVVDVSSKNCAMCPTIGSCIRRSSPTPLATWTPVTATSCTGKNAETPTASRRCSCTAAPAAAAHRRLFDPSAYRIVLFDQRGCGRSLPHASASGDLSLNTTWHLVDDIEHLRESPGISRWQVFGGSWGSTLALAYAEKYPELVLRGVFTLRSSEVDWYYRRGAAHVFPDLWEKFTAPIAGLDGDPVELYAKLLADPDPGVHGPAAVAWSTWEGATVTL